MLNLWTAVVDVALGQCVCASEGLSPSEPIPTLASTNSAGFYPKGISHWTRQAVETHVISFLDVDTTLFCVSSHALQRCLERFCVRSFPF